MTFASIKTILQTRQFDNLIGQDEDAWFEAKGRIPYNFANPAGRYELAKDVSAFANADGGILIVGLTTAPVAEMRTERVIAFDLCTQAEFDVAQHQGLIKEYVHPPIKDLNVYWTPVNQEATQGLGVIEVPAQSAKLKYFIIVKVVEAGTQIKQIVFGLAKRNNSANDPLTVAELYRHMQDGKHTVPQTLARLEEKLDDLIQAQAHPAARQQNPDELYAERAARLLEDETL
jgi:predicted HTH transcriptional regulator